MESAQKILAVILAGGLGRRMEGAPKPLLELGGRRLIDHVAERALRQGLPVALNLHDISAEAAAPFQNLGLPYIADAVAGHAGPLAGVLGALDHAAAHDHDAVLSLPCDSPFLPDDLAARLAEAARASRDGLACASSGGRRHPVIALWPVGLRADLRRALTEQGISALGQFQAFYDTIAVDWPILAFDPFFNINRPADLAEAEAILRL